MMEHARLIQKLRDCLKGGATPSRLIRDIISYLGDNASAREVQNVLEETFKVPVVRIGPSLESVQKGCKSGIFNRTLLAEIVANMAQWDGSTSSSGPEESSWLDGLQVTSPADVRMKVAEEAYP